MIIVMKPTATQDDVKSICDLISSLRYQPRVTVGTEQTVIACIGSEVNPQIVPRLETLDCVQEIIHVSKKYKLVSREFKPEDTVIDIKGTKIGGGNVPVMAGPCAVESYEQLRQVVVDLTAQGINVIRAMVYKPRTSTYDFQGLKNEGIRAMRKVKEEFPNIAFITEVPPTSSRWARAIRRITICLSAWDAPASRSFSSAAWPGRWRSGCRAPST